MFESRWAIHLTAMFTVACYLIRVLCDLGDRSHRMRERIAKTVWTTGCVFLGLHFLAAFHGEHDWSHQQAWEHTARQTEAVTGWFWGGGIYFNYAFLLYWMWDVFAWWKWGEPTGPQYWAMHGVFAMMMINATAVFGPMYWWWVIGGFVVVAGVFWRVNRSARTPGN